MATIIRPSCQVRLQIRIDEGTDTAALRGRLEQESPGQRLPSVPTGSPTDAIGGEALSKDAALASNRDSFRIVAGARALLSPEQFGDITTRLDEQRINMQLSGPDQQRPQGVEPVDDLVLFGGIVPTEAEVERNGIHDPDTLEVTLDFRDAPIDPRVVRACFVEAVLGTVSAEDYEAGLRGVRRDDGTLMSVVSRSEGQDVRAGSTTRFVGFVDEWSVDNSEDGDVVTLKCRDLTSALIGKRLPTGVQIDMTKPIADGVQELLDRWPSTRGMRVVFGSPSSSPSRFNYRGPVPGDAIPKTHRPRRGRKAGRVRQGTQMSVWDHITDTVVATGYVPVLRGYQLFLAEPRTLYSDRARSKKLVYGRDLERLKFNRKLATDVPVPTIEVRCADPGRGRTLWARAPQLDDSPGPYAGVFGVTDPPIVWKRANKVTSGGATEEEVRVFVVTGFNDLEALKRVAQGIFEQWGRQEIEGEFETDNVLSVDGDDLLDMQPADSVEVLVAPLNAESNQDATNTSPGGSPSSLQELTAMSVGRRAAFLRDLGWSRSTAQRLAEAQELTRLVSTFRVSTVRLAWSIKDGIKVSGDFVNYLVVREEGGSTQALPSAAAAAASLGRTSSAASALRDRSAASGSVGNRLESGELSSDEYASEGADANASTGRAARLNREVG